MPFCKNSKYFVKEIKNYSYFKSFHTIQFSKWSSIYGQRIGSEEISNSPMLGPRHTRHFDAQYCDKKIFLSHWFLLAMVSSNWTTNQGTLCFFESLPWLVIEIHGSKISFNRNIFLSFYHNTVCQNVSSE